MSHGHRRLRTQLIQLSRTIHIYLTLFALALTLLFAVTGLLLNHEALFGLDTTVNTSVSGKLPPAMLQPVQELAIVEELRRNYQATGLVESFDQDGGQIQVVFRGARGTCEAVIEAASGQVTVTRQSNRFLEILNELHRGKRTGAVWSVAIDFSAIMLVLAAITGIILWYIVPKRRTLGFVTILLGLVACVVVFWYLVP